LDLFYLIVQLLGSNQQSIQTSASGQLSIAGEKQTSFSASPTGQLMVRGVILVRGVVAEYSQPLGQPTEHAIGE
jgi:hypothetical protein